MGRELPPEVYTRDEMSRVLRSCGRGRTGVRNRALIVVLWRAGLRVSEALALRPQDLSPAEGTVRVRKGKTGPRTVGMDAQAFAALEGWQRLRMSIKGARKVRPPLFCTLTLRPVETKYVRAMLGRLAKRARLGKRLHAHGFRHTLAVEMAAEGQPPHVIQHQLGHKSLKTTTVYLAHLTGSDLAQVMRGRPGWRQDG